MFRRIITWLTTVIVLAVGFVGLSSATFAGAATGSEVAVQAPQTLPTCHGPWWHAGRGWTLKLVTITKPGYAFPDYRWVWVCNPRG
jgi:hypothetical protein